MKVLIKELDKLDSKITGTFLLDIFLEFSLLSDLCDAFHQPEEE